MTDLIAFLNARLGEDERVAKLAAGVPWVAATRMVHVDPAVIRENKLAYGRLGFVATVEHAVDLTHIARHDPARVLADVDAKRRVIDLVTDGFTVDAVTPFDVGDEFDDGYIQAYRDIARLLALPYADHPDYREEWAP